MPFPLGKPILVMIGIAIVAGSLSLFHPAPKPAEVTLWLYADSHARMYREPFTKSDGTTVPSLIDQFTTLTGHTARANLIAGAAMDVRLMSLLMSNTTGPQVPDVAEVEIGQVGKYFRPPINEVGFIPLDSYLEKSGWKSRIIASRFIPWTKDGIIFGVPHDLHPAGITYRKDLYDQSGVDLSQAKTWTDFQTLALQFQNYWHNHGRDRFAIGWSSSSSDSMIGLLLQQHVNLVNPDLSVHLTDEKTIQTLLWYTRSIAGPMRIATDFNPAPGLNIRDLENGDICAILSPDWQVGYIKHNAPNIRHLAMIPWPKFSPDDTRTASWAGTMAGILRTCPNPDLAFKLIEHLYLDRRSLEARQAITGILPPIPEYWSDPAYQKPDEFYDGQKTNALLLSLANEIPPRYMTPYTIQSQIILSYILTKAVAMEKSHPELLEQNCRQWLATGQSDLLRMIEFDKAAQ